MKKNKETKTGGDNIDHKTFGEICDEIKKRQIAASILATHPESVIIRKLEWEGMITIRFEDTNYSGDNAAAQSRRRLFVKLLMNNLRRKWNLRRSDYVWVATIEWGMSNKAHCHILLNFNTLLYGGASRPDLRNFKQEAQESMEHVGDLLDILKGALDLDWQPTFDNYGLVHYFSKIEKGRESYKDFFWSYNTEKLIEEIIDDVAPQQEGGQA